MLQSDYFEAASEALAEAAMAEAALTPVALEWPLSEPRCMHIIAAVVAVEPLSIDIVIRAVLVITLVGVAVAAP